MQFLFRERAGFVDAVAAYGEPVKEWRAVKINKLAEEVLVHLRRRVRVAPDGEFQPRLEHDAGITDAQHRLHTNIENRVQSVAAHDGQLAGKGEAAAEIAQAKVAIDGQEMLRTIPERAAYFRLLLRARRSGSAEERGVQLIDGCIFKNSFCAEAVAHGQVWLNLRAFFSGCLDDTTLGNIVLSGELIGMSKSRKRMQRVMPLAVDVGPGKLILVIVLVFSSRTKREQRPF